jgi:thymidylate synthase ThyX
MVKQDATYLTIQEMMKKNAIDPDNRVSFIDDMRRVMGTLPDMEPPFETPFYRGVEGITVKMIESTDNPYKAFYTMAAATWGKKIDKWADTPIEGRIAVVKGVLEGKTLPAVLETAMFTFAFEKVSRWAFDQIARQRLGVVFGSMGTRDNNHLDMGFRVHESIWKDPEKLRRFKETCLLAKDNYKYFVQQGMGSWQEARALLPISCTHNFSGTYNYAAVRSFCGKRMQACEAEDVVAVAYLMREEIEKKYPLLAKYLRPSCDWAGKCTYHESYSMSEAFGALFSSCGRNPEKAIDGEGKAYEYAHQNGSCSSYETISEQIKLPIAMAGEDMPHEFNVFLSPLDMALFEAE